MKIKAEVLENILALCGEAYPREIGGLLLGAKKRLEINDFVLVPGRFDYHSIYIHLDRLPIYVNLLGTFHSHPNQNPSPSRADLNLFSRLGRFHVIFAYPYDLNSFVAYDTKGNKMKLEII